MYVVTRSNGSVLDVTCPSASYVFDAVGRIGVDEPGGVYAGRIVFTARPAASYSVTATFPLGSLDSVTDPNVS